VRLCLRDRVGEVPATATVLRGATAGVGTLIAAPADLPPLAGHAVNNLRTQPGLPASVTLAARTRVDVGRTAADWRSCKEEKTSQKQTCHQSDASRTL